MITHIATAWVALSVGFALGAVWKAYIADGESARADREMEGVSELG